MNNTLYYEERRRKGILYYNTRSDDEFSRTKIKSNFHCSPLHLPVLMVMFGDLLVEILRWVGDETILGQIAQRMLSLIVVPQFSYNTEDDIDPMSFSQRQFAYFL